MQYQIVVYPSTSGETYRVYVEKLCQMKLLFIKPLQYWVTVRMEWHDDFIERDFYEVGKALAYIKYNGGDIANTSVIFRNPYGELL